METLVLATNNKGKLKEMLALLPGKDVRPQGEFFSEEAGENGLSFIENALLKARFASAKTGLPAIADDSGIEVAALNGEPGIYSARYAGIGATDRQNLNKLLEKMDEVEDGQRQASYYCAMVCVRHANDPTPLIGLGRWKGVLLRHPRGEGGFGYDPIFYVPEFDCTAAELDPIEKNKISHRAQALRSLIAQLA
ncbi:RdgB/HAM1 family non-canonical purine NTP pyrophosphatase [Thiomicrospira microaerophila]|uniref:RdgB/HAM1 family non-canonical purine NTP pyrophosphatase n=1 Tax=Thiomicrospira microaerophila TaxID=406020 RepID=UPI00200C98BC|nr:RdgB/HAM1 family non-canonical purine NTP pyrophosphatase [Thiomicrospira microaerophila]UQB42365.1 RdgB/HAM1 family non-canonical purine NTP pyrophosphatase [Thiomicrospira microaerophila]